MWAKLISWAAGTAASTWMKMGLMAAALALVTYLLAEVHKASQADEKIAQLTTDLFNQQQEYDKLVKQNKANTEALMIDRDKALQIASDTEAKLDEISHTPQADDGVVRPVNVHALDWVRTRNSSHH